MQVGIPDAVESTGSNVGQIQRSRPGRSKCTSGEEKRRHLLVNVLSQSRTTGRADTEKGPVESRLGGYVNCRLVQVRSLSPNRGIGLIAQRIINTRHKRAIAIAKRDGDGKMGDVTGEIVGAVEWIDHPLSVDADAVFSAFFGEQGIMGKAVSDDVNNRAIGAQIEFGDRIVAIRLRIVRDNPGTKPLAQYLAGGMQGSDRYLQAFGEIGRRHHVSIHEYSQRLDSRFAGSELDRRSPIEQQRNGIDLACLAEETLGETTHSLSPILRFDHRRTCSLE